MTVNQAIKALEQMRALGHGSLPLVMFDTRSGVSESVSSLSVRLAKGGDGWECDAEEGTPYAALYV